MRLFPDTSYEGGYVGLLLLLVGSAILVFLYLNYTPLKMVPGPQGQPTTEAQIEIQSAQHAKQLLEAQNAETAEQLK